MVNFKDIYDHAAERQGGEKELHDLLIDPLSKEELASLEESCFLAEMTRCVFQAGFSWKVIEQKWSGFEDVFHGFDPNKILGLLPDDWEEIGKDKRIVRNPQKIRSVRANAQFIEDIALEYGGFSTFIADWDESDLIRLFELFKKRGSRLGGITGQRFLRNIGKDTFILTKDVVACLRNNGLDIKSNPTSKRELTAIQETFNQWHHETGIPFTHLSKIAAFSVSY